ncbi:MAG: tetratricopeptide repeat protein [Candidatus Dormibacteria bacterium]
MAELPTGLVTFVFTDIEGSTRLLEHLGEESFREALGSHHRIIREATAAHQGVEVHAVGDGFFLVFARASDALAAALEAQLAIAKNPWPGASSLRVRMGLHTGEGRPGGDDYVGLAVHQAARVCSAAHGGQVVATQATMAAGGALPGRASWLPMGRHRLKDLGAAVELFQLCHDELPSENPPLRSLESVAHNLPIQASSFLGRSDELAEGARLLRGTRLLSVTGPGGTGKTRLCYQLAAEQLHEYPDGVWVAELGLVSDPALAPASLMAAVGLREEPGRGATETLVSHLRSRQALVVLDNCEHLITPAAALATELLRSCGKLRVLATSREPLRVSGETVWSLGPLALPLQGTEIPLAELAAADAVALFCERAAEARAGFTLNSDNAEQVTRICTRLEGIPLAIELAAARVRTLPLAQIAERLQDSLDLLTKGARGVDDRQASLRGAISWSHDLLSEPEKVLFRRLAVFTGGFTLDAAEEICAGGELAGGDVVELLDGLVDKSLVTFGEGRAGEGRYAFLETIRTYAAERLHAAAEVPAIAERHCDFYRRFANDCNAEQGKGIIMARLETDHPNVLASLDHLSSRGSPIRHGQLVADLSQFWDLRGHWRLARRELLRYLDRADRERGLEATCLAHLGRFLFNLGDYPRARVRYEEAVSIARELGDRLLESRCVGGLGQIASSRGNYADARTRFEEALDIARDLGHRGLEGQWMGDLGIVAIRLGEYPEARVRFEQAMGIGRELGDRRLEGYWVGRLGYVAYRLGDYAEARARNHEGLGIARELGERRLEGYMVAGLGEVAFGIGDYPGAEARYREALVISRGLGDRNLESQVVSGLGDVALGLGDHPRARELYEQALEIARDLGERRLEGQWFANLGNVASAVGDHAQARARYIEALVVARELGKEDTDLLEGCAEFLSRVGRWEDAADLLSAADGLNTRSHKARSVSAQARYEATLLASRERLGDAAMRAASQRAAGLGWKAAAEWAMRFIDRI